MMIQREDVKLLTSVMTSLHLVFQPVMTYTVATQLGG